MSTASGGAIVGLLAGAALVLLLSWLDARRPPRLIDRLGPYMGVRGSAFTAGAEPTGLAGTLLAVVGRDRRGTSDREDADLALRLLRAGMRLDPAQYRLQRLGWAVAGGCLGVGVSLLVGFGERGLAPAMVLGVTGAVGGWLVRDLILARAERSRRSRIDHQMPAFAELLALAVAAGASPAPALQRAAASVGGPLGEETARAMDDVRAGASLPQALKAWGHRTGCASVQRLAEAMVVASERGTPLAEVLRAQAMDARAMHARLLVEQAGRKDVAMLVPVVFLVLPSVVLIALYPGVASLRLVVP